MNSSELAAAAQSATQISLDEAVTVKVRSYEVGQIIRIDTPRGDSYIGEIESIASHLGRLEVTLNSYSAWYDGDAEPYSSPYPDDSVLIAITDETIVSVL